MGMAYGNGNKGGRPMKKPTKGQPLIRCPDGVLRTYAEWEDKIKPLWKEQMRREYLNDEM